MTGVKNVRKADKRMLDAAGGGWRRIGKFTSPFIARPPVIVKPEGRNSNG